MSRKIVMTLVCILVLGLSGCGDTLTLNQYNTSEIWYIAYTDIDTVCESNELTADGSSILHSEEDYLLLSYGQYILGKPANGLGNRAIYQPAAS